MKNFRTIILLLSIAYSMPGYSQSHHVQFDHIGTSKGLSQSTVLSILQDKKGFMWFGTRDGLNKYDGYSFKVYKSVAGDKTSISNNYITGLVESKTGDLWISTLGGGFCRYDRNKENFVRYRHNTANSNSLCSDVVNHIMEDELGNLWLGTELGLDMFNPLTNSFEHYFPNASDTNTLSDSYARFIYKDSDNDIWICTKKGGINRFNRKTKTFTRYQHDKNNSQSIGNNNIYSIFEDSKHRLWIGTVGSGLEMLDKKTGIFRHYKHDDNNPNSVSEHVIYTVNEDAENNLWIGTENGGLSILNYSTGVFTIYKNDEIDKESIGNNSIKAIYRDAKNNMWLGNFSAGIDLLNRDKSNFAHYNHMMQSNSLSDNHVLSIFEDSKKKIWIGTDGGGLNMFDPATGKFTRFKHQTNNSQSICGNYVLSACEDRKGNIWIGTWGNGVTVYNPKKNTYRHYKNDPANAASLSNNNAWKIFEDKQGNIWIGSFGAGLDMLNADQKSFTHYSQDVNNPKGRLSSNNVVSIFEDVDGEMWVCTDGGGLNLFNKKNKTFTSFLHDDLKNSLSNNSVNSIWQDGNKDFWISTRTGLSHYNQTTNKFTVYTTAHGLPDNIIFGVLEDDRKNLWISTNKGISRFNPATKTFKNYSVSDGLQGDEFKGQAYCKTSTGMMYFGGNNGFNQFFPDSIKEISFDPPLVITNFQVFNKKVPIASDSAPNSSLSKSITETDSITLPYSNSVFSFEFATLNFTTSDKKQYAYMLEGFDKGWNIVSDSRMATYTNLDPGKYTFKVKGLNNSGEWSSNIRTIQLFIEPPYWLTWWFKLCSVIVLVGGSVAYYLYRMNAIQSQKIKLQQKVYEQTIQLVLSADEEHKARKEAEHSHKETERANHELKLKNKELEQFAYVASHDLQEPLRTTSGFVELLQQQYNGKLDDKADKYLNYISDASDRMKTLIKDLLDFSRLGTNVQLKKIDCNLLVKNMLSDIMLAVNESGAEIEYSDMPVVNGYATELKLLFQNLVINAIKFRRKGALPQIKIDVEKLPGYWQFSVSDNGIGIEPQHQERIFDIFQRLHTRTEYNGSGIGLSHCKKIVELHQGKIWVDSVPGQGSAFYFTIPADETLSEIKTPNPTKHISVVNML